MPIKFKPCYSITPNIANQLLRIEAVKEQIRYLPLTPQVLASLCETARLNTIHYSTMIEGNQLKPAQVEQVIKNEKTFAGREHDENEVKGYYTALQQVELWAFKKTPITEKLIQQLHALVMGKGKKNGKPTSYRDGQNVIRNSRTKTIVYLPPEAKDVPKLMHALVQWIIKNKNMPQPLVAGIVHYQLATIHPYFDGNGRTARLLTTLILHLGGYDLKGLYSLEEYYAQKLNTYYNALSIGPSHNYYSGRATADITPWLTYFIEGMANSFERVLARMDAALKSGAHDESDYLHHLDPKQRKALALFSKYKIVTAKQIGELFNFKPRTSAHLCKKWVDSDFLVIVNPSNKGRTYKLAQKIKIHTKA